MFEDDGLWPCKCGECEHEWYTSVAAMRADRHAVCPVCSTQNFIPLSQFTRALQAARAGSYDFSYLVRISPQFRSGARIVPGRSGTA